MTAPILLPLLALSLGFVLARANTCTVASVERLAHAGKPDWLLGLAVAAASSGLTLVSLDLGGVSMDGLPGRLPLGWGPLAGGALIGLGAVANKACMLGSISQLGRGNANYLLTLGGMGLSLVLFRQGVLPAAASAEDAAMHFMVGDHGALALAGFAALVGLGLVRLVVVREDVWFYLIATGLLGGLLFAFNPGWSYLAAIGRGMRGEWGGAALQANVAAVCLFAGATVSLWLRDRLDLQAIAWRPALGCFVGGLAMGTGAQLVPGGNDTLLLWTVPGLAWYGALAYLAMMITITALVYGQRWWAIRR
jgi:hypothetical protein